MSHIFLLVGFQCAINCYWQGEDDKICLNANNCNQQDRKLSCKRIKRHIFGEIKLSPLVLFFPSNTILIIMILSGFCADFYILKDLKSVHLKAL